LPQPLPPFLSVRHRAAFCFPSSHPSFHFLDWFFFHVLDWVFQLDEKIEQLNEILFIFLIV
jgi:hypothetical protein